jgi:hypothetical protein
VARGAVYPDPSILKPPCNVAVKPVIAMRRLALGVTIALGTTFVAAAQAPLRPAREKPIENMSLSLARSLVDDWSAAVRAHKAGTIDGPVKTIAKWPPEHVTLVLHLVSPTPNAARMLMLGLSLHTDIAIAERYWPRDGNDAVLLVDGQVKGYVARSAHWPLARQIAADLAKRPGEGPRVAAWYRATAALMQEWRSLDLLGRHLEAGQTLFVDDPVLALYQGTLRQVIGDPRLFDYLRKHGSTGSVGKPPLASRDGALTESRSGLGPLPTSMPNASKVELGVARRDLII